MHPSCVIVASRMCAMPALQLYVRDWECTKCEGACASKREEEMYLLLGISRIATFNNEQEKYF
ncbi:hypothetical protein GmHk_08G022298 [Glycine max]|nr:hypothetical protein GmHk_08G022298 [Glycine max]